MSIPYKIIKCQRIMSTDNYPPDLKNGEIT